MHYKPEIRTRRPYLAVNVFHSAPTYANIDWLMLSNEIKPHALADSILTELKVNLAISMISRVSFTDLLKNCVRKCWKISSYYKSDLVFIRINLSTKNSHCSKMYHLRRKLIHQCSCTYALWIYFNYLSPAIKHVEVREDRRGGAILRAIDEALKSGRPCPSSYGNRNARGKG